MKKMILVFIFAITISQINAENLFDINWNSGNLGLGMNYSSGNDGNIEFTVSIINLSFRQNDLNIWIEFNPAKYWLLIPFERGFMENDADSKFSFIDTALYWNFMRHESFFLGPLVSVNYLFINVSNGINWNDFIFTGALRFSFKLFDNRFYYGFNVISTEIGYRNVMGKNNFYFSVNTDMILFLLLGLAGA